MRGGISLNIERRVSVTKDPSLGSGVITTDDGCQQAYLVEEVGLNHKPDSVARSFGKPRLAGDQWACWACSYWAYEGSGACQVGCLEEGGAGWEVLRETRPGHHRRRRSRCLGLVREHSGMPGNSQHCWPRRESIIRRARRE